MRATSYNSINPPHFDKEIKPMVLPPNHDPTQYAKRDPLSFAKLKGSRFAYCVGSWFGGSTIGFISLSKCGGLMLLYEVALMRGYR